MPISLCAGTLHINQKFFGTRSFSSSSTTHRSLRPTKALLPPPPPSLFSRANRQSPAVSRSGNISFLFPPLTVPDRPRNRRRPQSDSSIIRPKEFLHLWWWSVGRLIRGKREISFGRSEKLGLSLSRKQRERIQISAFFHLGHYVISAKRKVLHGTKKKEAINRKVRKGEKLLVCASFSSPGGPPNRSCSSDHRRHNRL